MIRVFIIFNLCLVTTICSGQTQIELNENATKDYEKADKELNSVYQNILKEYSQDTAFIRNFKKAQRLWIQFRDVQMLAKYPDRKKGYYGSVQPMCWILYKTELTTDRTKKLNMWLEKTEEGDVCSGSVNIKN